jgi:hypothetical protein
MAFFSAVRPFLFECKNLLQKDRVDQSRAQIFKTTYGQNDAPKAFQSKCELKDGVRKYWKIETPAKEEVGNF